MVHYSPEPLVHYRQHESTLIGANNTWAARLVRIRMTFEGRFRSWTDKNPPALSFCAGLLTEESRETISTFKRERYGNALQRLYWLWQAKVFRQIKKGSVALYIACFLGLL
jgi:hypothetical protein